MQQKVNNSMNSLVQKKLFEPELELLDLTSSLQKMRQRIKLNDPEGQKMRQIQNKKHSTKQSARSILKVKVNVMGKNFFK